jgi:hypothetical protein
LRYFPRQVLIAIAFLPAGFRTGEKNVKKTTTAIIATLAALALGSTALATMEIQKEYKAKDAKANCASCHVEKMPKKETAGLNELGKTVKAAKGADGKIDWAKVTVPAAK